MTQTTLKKEAQEILESKLGFKVSRNDITLFESSDNGIVCNYLAFGRFGFNRIEYRATYNVNQWDLEIVDTITNESLYI